MLIPGDDDDDLEQEPDRLIILIPDCGDDHSEKDIVKKKEITERRNLNKKMKERRKNLPK